MKYTLYFFLCSTLLLNACKSHELEKQKGISLNQTTENSSINDLENNQQFNDLQTRPGKVLFTGHDNHRLVSIFKVNYSPKTEEYFTGSNAFHTQYYYDEDGNGSSGNYMPGLEATHGYNMLNVAHYNSQTNQRNNFFNRPVLVNTIYYPSFVEDSIMKEPVRRDFYLVSVYDEDTNNDSLINHKDLRRFYYFDIDGENKKLLIPATYGVMGSQYDAKNDHMIIRARLDKNNNGKLDSDEAVHLFWIDLKKPEAGVRSY